jgi:hypothetical protein
VDRVWDYLYREHSRAEIRAWARALAHVRYCRAYGGHANDVDRFAVALATPDRAALLAAAAGLGLALVRIPAGAPTVEPGKVYQGAALAERHWPIDVAPDLEAPRAPVIAGVRVGLWIGNGGLVLSIYPQERDSWSLTDDDFAAAERLDGLVRQLAWPVIDPPQDNDHCFCPKYHPQLWAPG